MRRNAVEFDLESVDEDDFMDDDDDENVVFCDVFDSVICFIVECIVEFIECVCVILLCVLVVSAR